MIQVDPVRSDPTYPVRVSPLHADVDLTPKIILIIKIIVNVVNIENALCKCILILIISTRTITREKEKNTNLQDLVCSTSEPLDFPPSLMLSWQRRMSDI